MFSHDILPIASGQANIGIHRGVGAGSFNISSIKPFLLVSQLSGVFHDSRGSSGILRFSAETHKFQISNNGGLTFTDVGPDTSQTLQILYNNGETILATSAFGDVNFISLDSSIVFATDSSRAPINISGIVLHPGSTHELGDLTMLTHSIVSGSPIHGLTTLAIARAKSLGLGTLLLNTGSGLANISIGSGLAQFRCGGSITVDGASTSGVAIAMTVQDFFDANYIVGNIGGAGDVPPPRSFTILSPGLYRISYNISFQRTSGSNPRTIKTYVRRNLHESMINGTSYSMHRDTTNDENTCQGSLLVEANAGDFFTFFAQYASTSTASTIAILQDDCWCVVEKIGTRRHEARIAGL